MADKTLATLYSETGLANLTDNDLIYVGSSLGVSDGVTTITNLRLYLQKSRRCINPADYGVKADGKRLIDCTFTTAGNTISSVSYPFANSDIGKVIVVGPSTVEDSRTPGAYTFRGTILSVSSGVATLSGTAGTTQSGNGVCVFGTDDTVSLQNALNAAAAPDTTDAGPWAQQGMGCLELPVGRIMVTASINLRTKVSIVGQGARQSEIYWASANRLGGTGNEGVLNGYVSNGSSKILRDVQLRDFAINAYSAFVTTYSYNNKTLVATYLMNFVVKNCAFLGSPGTGIGVDYLTNALIEGNYIENPGRLFVTTGGGGSGIDFQSNRSSGWAPYGNSEWEGYMITNNTIYNPAVGGIRNTNDRTTVGNIKTQIIGNRVFTTKAGGKGIEDCGNNGAIIMGNVCVNTVSGGQTSAGNGSVDQEAWGGIHSYGGQNGMIVNNRIQGYHRGIRLMRFLYSGSNLMPNDYMIDGNMITDSYDCGISLEVNSPYVLDSVSIRNNNIINAGAEGIAAIHGGTGGTINDLIIQNNRIKNCGTITAVAARKSGIRLNVATDGLQITGNYFMDRQGTPTMANAITVDGVAVTNEHITTNHMKIGITTPINTINTGTISNSNPTGNYV